MLVRSRLDPHGTDCRFRCQQHRPKHRPGFAPRYSSRHRRRSGRRISVGATGVTGFNPYSMLVAVVGAVVVLGRSV